MFFCQHLWAHSQFMTIFIRWAHVVYKYFSFILGMASSVLYGLWVQHGLDAVTHLYLYFKGFQVQDKLIVNVNFNTMCTWQL